MRRASFHQPGSFGRPDRKRLPGAAWGFAPGGQRWEGRCAQFSTLAHARKREPKPWSLSAPITAAPVSPRAIYVHMRAFWYITILQFRSVSNSVHDQGVGLAGSYVFQRGAPFGHVHRECHILMPSKIAATLMKAPTEAGAVTLGNDLTRFMDGRHRRLILCQPNSRESRTWRR
jgi:hypothetical protein